MKKVTVMEPHDKWIANDGTEFTNEDKCIAYEQKPYTVNGMFQWLTDHRLEFDMYEPESDNLLINACDCCDPYDEDWHNMWLRPKTEEAARFLSVLTHNEHRLGKLTPEAHVGEWCAVWAGGGDVGYLGGMSDLRNDFADLCRKLELDPGTVLLGNSYKTEFHVKDLEAGKWIPVGDGRIEFIYHNLDNPYPIVVEEFYTRENAISALNECIADDGSLDPVAFNECLADKREEANTDFGDYGYGDAYNAYMEPVLGVIYDCSVSPDTTDYVAEMNAIIKFFGIKEEEYRK